LSYIDEKFIKLLGPRFRNFKQKSSKLWNFSCPYCGDSSKDKLKARGYFFSKKGTYLFHCHNCSVSLPLWKFLKEQDHYLYTQYQLETFQDTKPKEDFSKFVCTPVFEKKSDFSLPLVSSLHKNHSARKYLEGRMVPLNKVYYAEDFSEFVNNILPSNTKTLYKEPRIVIPFYDPEGNLLGFQGRSIGESKVKYITIKTNETNPKVYGWDKIDGEKTITVVEGIFDSFFVYNSVASLDAALYHIPTIIGKNKDYVFVYDNECRNSQIVSNMRKTIGMGYKVCVWPDDFKYKDINDGVIEGLAGSVIQHIIDTNTYQGLMATMKLNQWSKV
jgi:hypothetical protein